MNKEKFIEILTKIEELDKRQDNLNDALRSLSPDFSVDFYPLNTTIQIIIDLLNDEFGLKADVYNETDIEYFVYTLNYGKEASKYPITITDKDGSKDYYLTDASALYDFLTRDK